MQRQDEFAVVAALDRLVSLVDGNHLEVSGVAKPEQMIVRAHVGVLAAKGDVYAEAHPKVCHTLFQRGRDDGEVVELGHAFQEVSP